MAKDIVPVAPTGTRGRYPSMEGTGITYKTRLKWKNKLEYAKYAKSAEYHLVFFGPCTLPALKHRHSRGTACQCPSLYGF